MRVGLGLIVPAEARSLFRRALEGLDGVRVRWGVYNDEASIRSTVEQVLPDCDALCFAGPLSLERALPVIPEDMPYADVVPTPLDISLSFLRARALGMELTPASIDSVPEHLVVDLLAELGLARDSVAVLPFDGRTGPEEIAEFHRRQQSAIGARYALTARNSVFHLLDGTLGAPVVRVLSTASTITATVRELSLRAVSIRKEDLHLSAAIFRAEPSPDDAVPDAAERIAAVLQSTMGWKDAWIDVRSGTEVLVLGHKKLMRDMTHQWRSLDLLDQLGDVVRGRVVAGFGLGESTRSCVHYATLAAERAHHAGVSCAFLLTEQGVVLGPLLDTGERPTRYRFKSDDAALERLSRQTGLGVATLTQLIELDRRLDGASISAEDLGTSLNLTATSGRRILRALRQDGLAAAVGSSQPSTRGRPKHLYRLRFSEFLRDETSSRHDSADIGDERTGT
ncbi:helix-turn-helix domain-containing protein [Jiangella rhizosphaerae]|uniref:Transcriptional regulator n=1 Tax=Jiangella rhizosphaerae TaxID=2293569 RepID=A0A418KM18_9ACTN|nr:hypothetical protein [Jiangella rhizosphaerae]RIQ19008.1 hypothetical protein DY240_20290 [Jiangella rhizosphaerae]